MTNTLLLKLDAFGPFYFARGRNRHIKLDEQDEILGAARYMIACRVYDPERSSVNTYVQRIITYAHRGHNKLKADDAKAAEQLAAAEEKHQFYREFPDILEEVDTQGRDEFLTSNIKELFTPPYKVQWRDGQSVETYADDPYHVPYFAIVPANEDFCALQKTKSGNLRNIREERLSDGDLYALRHVRARFSTAVRDMVSEYLFRFGFQTLEPEHRQLVARFNRGEKPLTIQQGIGIHQYTYYAYIKVLERRGWRKEWHRKKKHDVMLYHPCLDKRKRLHDGSGLITARGLSLKERMEISEEAVPTPDELLDDKKGDAAFDRYMTELEDGLVGTALTASALLAHDERLRAFVERLVRRPVLADNLTFEQTMELLIGLPQERQRDIIFTAMRKNTSVADALALPDYFPEFYEHEALVVDFPRFALAIAS